MSAKLRRGLLLLSLMMALEGTLFAQQCFRGYDVAITTGTGVLSTGRGRPRDDAGTAGAAVLKICYRADDRSCSEPILLNSPNGIGPFGGGTIPFLSGQTVRRQIRSAVSLNDGCSPNRVIDHIVIELHGRAVVDGDMCCSTSPDPWQLDSIEFFYEGSEIRTRFAPTIWIGVEGQRLLGRDTRTVANGTTTGAEPRQITQPRNPTAPLGPDGRTLLHGAVLSRDLRLANQLIGQGVPVDIADASGDSPLHLAVRTGDPNLVRFFMDRLANPNVQNNAMRTPIDDAFLAPQSQQILQMIFRTNRAAPLNRYLDKAFQIENYAAVFLLLNSGADANFAMSLASIGQSVPVFQRIIQQYRVTPDINFYASLLRGRRYDMAQMTLEGYGGVTIDPNQALNAAVSFNVASLVDVAMGKGAQPDPALQYAMNTGNRSLVDRALQFRANPTAGLEWGVFANDLGIVRTALTMGGNPDRAMTIAAEAGYDAIVSEMLSRGANPNFGLVAAADNNRIALVERLVGAGANPNLAMQPAVDRNNTPLVEALLRLKADGRPPQLIAAAAKNGNIPIVEMLLAAGANANAAMPNAVGQNNLELTGRLLKTGANGRAPEYLQSAVRSGSRPMTELLLSAGADANVGMDAAVRTDKDDLTRLFMDRGANLRPAAYIERLSSRGNLELVTRLLNGGANPHDGLKSAIEGDRTAVATLLLERGKPACPPPGCSGLIGAAAFRNNVAITELLLKNGADPTAGVQAALTCPTGFATCSGSDRTLDLLLQAGAKVTAPELIAQSVTVNSSLVVGKLLDKGAPAAGLDANGQPLLQVAALRYNPEMMQMLLLHGADPNARNRAGDTALHILARDKASAGYPKFKQMEKARIPLVEVLLAAKGIDVNAANAAGESPLKRVDGDYVRDRLVQAGGAKDIAPAPRECSMNPMLYEDNLFRGKGLPASQDSSDLKVQNFRNKASSLCVPRGWTLVVFEKPDFQGSSHAINGPAIIFNMKDQHPGGQAWDNRVGSIRSSRMEGR